MLNTYNIVAEQLLATFSCITLFLMFYIKPRKTIAYIVNFTGIVLSITTTVTHIYLISLAGSVDTFNAGRFKLACIAFYTQYTLVLALMYIYTSLFSSKHRIYIKNVFAKALVLSMAYICIFAYVTAADSVYTAEGGVIRFSPVFKIYLLIGILNTVLCMSNCYKNRASIASVSYRYSCFVLPLSIVVFIAQMFCKIIQFSSFTYVLPFILFYLLFHSNPFDEISGCQNKYSFETRFVDNMMLRKRFLIVNVVFPKLKNADQNYLKDKIYHISAEKCREIARLHRGIHLYTFNIHNYALSVNVKNDEETQKIIDGVQQILDMPTPQAMQRSLLCYKMIAFKNNPKVDTLPKLSYFMKYLFSKLSQDTSNEYYVASEKDYEDFASQYYISQMLDDIKNRFDLDDERVLCFAQPIYSVEHKTFRTAEALMRLQLDGKIVYPDKFIPLAEQNGCIHTLTCIMLNKVCQQVRRLSADYDFDAITVNCSTTEFSEKNLHSELLAIIRRNNIPCSKIRLELTESAMFDDFSTVMHNIEMLRQSGVQFYLDDFGTGYSNLERIISCPFKTIKFDKSLLYKSMNSEGMNDLVVSMVDVFKKQGFVLLVEGVEDDEQNQYSIDKGFNYIQGYKYAKPVPIDELTNYFTAKPAV